MTVVSHVGSFRCEAGFSDQVRPLSSTPQLADLLLTSVCFILLFYCRLLSLLDEQVKLSLSLVCFTDTFFCVIYLFYMLHASLTCE